MTTAVETRSASSGQAPPKRDRAWLARSAEAHVLAAAIFRHFIATRERRAEGQEVLQDFQRALILQTAAQLGFAVESRRDLTAEQLGRISTALRARMQELGIPEPEARRDRASALSGAEGPASTSDWKQLTKLFDEVERALGWSKSHRLNFVKHQIGRRSLRRLTHGQAQAILRGLDGVLRHHRRECASAVGAAIKSETTRVTKEEGKDVRTT